MSEIEDASGPKPPPLPPSPPAPPPSGPSGDRLGLVLRSLGGVIGVLLIVLIAVLATGGHGSDLALVSSTTASPSISNPATTSSDPATTTPSTTSTTVVTSSTAGASTTAATTTTVVVLPLFVTEDCVTYDPAAVGVEDLGANGWGLTAGLSGLLLFDTERDALMGLAIAGNHTDLCFLGRGNTQPDPSRYIHEFWYGDSGARIPVPGPEDCLGHNPTHLSIESPGGDIWRLMDDGHSMLSFDGEADARAGLVLAQAFGEHCYIGRDNERSERRLYIVEYWK